MVDLLLGLLAAKRLSRKRHQDGQFFHGVARCNGRKFCSEFFTHVLSMIIFLFHFLFVISFVSELKWLTPGKIETTLRIREESFHQIFIYKCFRVFSLETPTQDPVILVNVTYKETSRSSLSLFTLESLGLLQRILVQKRRCCSSFSLFAKQNKKKFTLGP